MKVSDYLMVKTASVRKQAGLKQLKRMFQAMAKDPIAAAKSVGLGTPTASELAELTPEVRAEFHDIFTNKAKDVHNAYKSTNRGVNIAKNPVQNLYKIDQARNVRSTEESMFRDSIHEPFDRKLHASGNRLVNQVIKQDNKDFSKAFNNVDTMINKGYTPEQLNKSVDVMYPDSLSNNRSTNNYNFLLDMTGESNPRFTSRFDYDEAKDLYGAHQNNVYRENKVLSHIQNKKAELKAKINKRYNELNN